MTGAGPVSPGIEWSDPSWYPADLDIRGDRLAMLHIDRRVVEESTFMDTRIAADLRQSIAVDAAAVPGGPAGIPPVAWLFHTSFCCSTLLAKALHDHPQTVVYREPLVLRRLADARHEGRALGHWPVTCTNLLARPWTPGGRVIIKPTHASLNIAQALMNATPDSRALVLTSSLQDFLVSNIKKTAETQARIPALVEMALTAGEFHRRLPPQALSPPSLIAAAGLQWAAQRELLLDIAEQSGSNRVAVLDAEWLLADIDDAVNRAQAWWDLVADPKRRGARLAEVAHRHAKLGTREYGPQARAHEVALVSRLHAPTLQAANDWLQQHVLPAMRQEAVVLPAGQWSLTRLFDEQ